MRGQNAMPLGVRLSEGLGLRVGSSAHGAQFERNEVAKSMQRRVRGTLGTCLAGMQRVPRSSAGTDEQTATIAKRWCMTDNELRPRRERGEIAKASPLGRAVLMKCANAAMQGLTCCMTHGYKPDMTELNAIGAVLASSRTQKSHQSSHDAWMNP